MLRTLRLDPDMPESVHLAATDPANPYGALLPWPRMGEEDPTTPHGMARVSGASVVLVNGRLAAFLRRRNPALRAFLPEDEPERSDVARTTALKLAEVAFRRQSRKSGLFIGEINGQPAREHYLARYLQDAGFVETSMGYQMRRVNPVTPIAGEAATSDEADADEETTETA
jgi:ATP-dependent Lhr-like helicase